MNDDFTKAVIQHGIDKLGEMISWGEPVPTDELHHRLYNEDYFVIGYYNAEKLLEKYGTFQAIEDVVNYEKENFGEVTTEINSEAIANMLAYIKGEEALANCDTRWDTSDDELSVKQLKAIKKELAAQL